jgi:hypothetical protein
MANPEHVALLKRDDSSLWNDWRDSTDVEPDLRGANFSGREFGGYHFERSRLDAATIHDAQFVDCNFRGASFRNADGTYVTFDQCHLDSCDFAGAGLHRGRFEFTTAPDANFRGANLSWAYFDTCDLDRAHFGKALLSRASFSNVWLTNTDGLDSIVKGLPVSIGLETFFQSGGLPESLLQNAGVPSEFIQYAASLAGKPIDYYSCFLSYSSHDDDFARRLYNDLQGKNIRTWFAPEDLKIGDKLRSRIDESIRIHDKLVIILSANSANSNWVETEVESALEREQKEGKDVLFPIAIDEEGFTSKQPWAKDIRLKRHIGDFRQWKSHDDYTAAFDRLVRDLKKSQPPIIMKGG